MSYTLFFDQMPEYLFVRSDGRISYATGLDIWRQIGTRLLTTGYKTFSRRASGQKVSIGEMYLIVSRFSTFGLTGARIAFCDQGAETLVTNQFAALVAKNHGIDAKVFQELKSAEKWLRSDN